MEQKQDVSYIILFTKEDITNNCQRSHKISGTSSKNDWENNVLAEIAVFMVYSLSERFQSFSEYLSCGIRNVVVNIFLNDTWMPYEINEKQLMKLYIKKYNEYHVESDYEISDWAISSSNDENDDINQEWI